MREKIAYPVDVVRLVLDTSVVVAALRSATGASNALLRLVAEGRLVPLVPVPLFLEYEDLLKRPDQRLIHGLTIEEIEGFLMALASASEAVDIQFRWRPQTSDPGDEMVLETAINGRAEMLVTHNVRHFERASTRFQLRVIRPAELLRELRA